MMIKGERIKNKKYGKIIFRKRKIINYRDITIFATKSNLIYKITTQIKV